MKIWISIANAFHKKDATSTVKGIRIPLCEHVALLGMYPSSAHAPHWASEVAGWITTMINSTANLKKGKSLKEKVLRQLLWSEPWMPIETTLPLYSKGSYVHMDRVPPEVELTKEFIFKAMDWIIKSVAAREQRTGLEVKQHFDSFLN